MSTVAHDEELRRRQTAGTRPPLGTAQALRLLLVLSLAFAALALTSLFGTYLSSEGILAAPGRPFGSDFVNVWTTGKLVLSGAFDDIYRVARFDAFQETLTGGDIGHRLWANPPHSLLFVAPFGLGSYYAAYAGWTLAGLAVLVAGARRCGFDWLQTALLALSPAAIYSIGDGQSGNLVTGLLLFSVAAGAAGRRSSPLAAAILTIKPQAGFLLPLLWAVERRWTLILATGIVTLGLLVLSVAFFGTGPWKDYLGDTLPELSGLEREGTGPFLYMIPSAFIAMRVLGAEADVALWVHLAFACTVAALLAFGLWRIADTRQRTAMILIATCLMTPYLHRYDLGILLAGALLLLPMQAGRTPASRHAPALAAIAAAWAVPLLVGPLASLGAPVSPLIMFAVLVVACVPARRMD